MGGNPRDTFEVFNNFRSGNVEQGIDKLKNFINVFDPEFRQQKRTEK
jgi:hypothetical protein